jgi:hypothetical protein
MKTHLARENLMKWERITKEKYLPQKHIDKGMFSLSDTLTEEIFPLLMHRQRKFFPWKYVGEGKFSLSDTMAEKSFPPSMYQQRKISMYQ